MSFEKRTKVDSNIPKEDYAIIVEMRDVGGEQYNRSHVAMLGAKLQDVSVMPMTVQLANESMFARIDVRGHLGEEGVRFSAGILSRAASLLLLEPLVTARLAPYNQVNPDQPLDVTFNYMDDVTDVFGDEFNSAPKPSPSADFDYELSLMVGDIQQ